MCQGHLCKPPSLCWRPNATARPGRWSGRWIALPTPLPLFDWQPWADRHRVTAGTAVLCCPARQMRRRRRGVGTSWTPTCWRRRWSGCGGRCVPVWKRWRRQCVLRMHRGGRWSVCALPLTRLRQGRLSCGDGWKRPRRRQGIERPLCKRRRQSWKWPLRQRLQQRRGRCSWRRSWRGRGRQRLRHGRQGWRQSWRGRGRQRLRLRHGRCIWHQSWRAQRRLLLLLLLTRGWQGWHRSWRGRGRQRLRHGRQGWRQS